MSKLLLVLIVSLTTLIALAADFLFPGVLNILNKILLVVLYITAVYVWMNLKW